MRQRRAPSAGPAAFAPCSGPFPARPCQALAVIPAEIPTVSWWGFFPFVPRTGNRSLHAPCAVSCGAVRLLICSLSHSSEITALPSEASFPLARVTDGTPNLGIVLVCSLLWPCVSQSCEQEWHLMPSAFLLSKLHSNPIKHHKKILFIGT